MNKNAFMSNVRRLKNNEQLLFSKQRNKLFPNEIIPNVKIPNPKNGKNPKHKNPESPHLA
jgi:hypothetical protein